MSRAQRDAERISAIQFEIKKFCKEAVWKGYSRQTISSKINALINKILNEIEMPETKEAARLALFPFAAATLARFRNVKATMREAEQTLLVSVTPKKAKELARSRSARDDLLLKYLQDPNAYETATGARLYFREYHSKIVNQMREITKSGAYVQYDRRVNLRNICEMSVRYEYQQNMVADLVEDGEDLVWISTHANCSKRCEPFQGKLYSISGKRGKTSDGVPFVPLSVATDVFYTTKRGKVYRNGCIYGYNCRHELVPFRGRNSRPTEIPKEVIERQRKREQKMRAMERDIRYLKEKAEILKDILPQDAARAKLQAKALNAKYERFSKDSGMRFVRERTRVFDGENRYNRGNKS